MQELRVRTLPRENDGIPQVREVRGRWTEGVA